MFQNYQHKVDTYLLLVWIGHSRSSWYNKPREGKKGIKPIIYKHKTDLIDKKCSKNPTPAVS